jgi:hypothetical protein
MKACLLSVLFLAAALAAGAVPAGVSYTEGESFVRFKSGSQRDAAIGDILNTGDGVRTGADGLVELDQKGVIVHINPGTVFTLMEKEQKGKVAGVLSLVLGSVKFRYDRLTGQEPLIQTASCIAGVRGTELAVYAGVDGSSLIIVEKGAVEVEAEGATVALAPQEAVEVRPGQPPGMKYRPPSVKIDYRRWNEEKLQGLLADPAAAMQDVLQQLEYYIAKSGEAFDLYQEYSARLQKEREIKKALISSEQTEEAQALERETIFPLAVETGNLVLNYRYYALAALSLRRFVGGRMYLFLKAGQILNPGEPSLAAFREKYLQMLSEFEDKIVARLLEVDI